MTVLSTALLSYLLLLLMIRYADRLGLLKQIREQGPASHLKKSGTPVLGGAAFALAASLAYLFLPKDPLTTAVLLMALGYGILGAADDLLGARGRPLRAREKLVGQFLVALIFAAYAFGPLQFSPWPALDFVLITLVIVGSANAFNFTDGVDGLAATVTLIILLPFFPVPLVQAFIGGLLGFLWLNAPPAKIFMGDGGSELLGALVAGMYLIQGGLWLLPLAALIPVLEVVSVVLQVFYFRRTGKRIFRMSPLHHHFELSGWSEPTVVFRFAVITALATVLAFSLGGTI